MNPAALLNDWSPQTAVDCFSVLVVQVAMAWWLGQAMPGLCDRLLHKFFPDQYEGISEELLEPHRGFIAGFGAFLLAHFFVLRPDELQNLGSQIGPRTVVGLSRLLHGVIEHGLVLCALLAIAKGFSVWLKHSGESLTPQFSFVNAQNIKLVEVAGHFILGLLAAVYWAQRYLAVNWFFFVAVVVAVVLMREKLLRFAGTMFRHFESARGEQN